MSRDQFGDKLVRGLWEYLGRWRRAEYFCKEKEPEGEQSWMVMRRYGG